MKGKSVNALIVDSLAAEATRARLPGRPTTPPGPPQPRTGPTQCHDITVFPSIGLAGGACGGYGLLLDIRDPAHPVCIAAVADSNFSYWHSATFNNDGTKMLFSDEWGGGGQPKCRATDKKEWGSDESWEAGALGGLPLCSSVQLAAETAAGTAGAPV